MEDDFTRILSVPVDKVFMASAQVVAANWNVTHTDKDTYTISFKTGMNMRTWKGFDMSVVCLEMAGGRTKVQVHAQRRRSTQLFSWKEGNRVLDILPEAAGAPQRVRGNLSGCSRRA